MTSLVVTKLPVPTVTGLTITSGVKTTTLTWDPSNGETDKYVVYSNNVDDPATATQVAIVESNSFTPTGLTTTRFFWVTILSSTQTESPFSDSVEYTPAYITSADVEGSAPTSAGLSIGSSSGAGSLPTYGTWHAYVAGSFTPSDDSVVSISMYLASAISNVNVPFGQEVKVWARTRLRNTTLNQDVPSGTKQYLLYNSMGFAYGSLNNLNNFHETFITGFRGLLVPGHSYTLYGELMKERTGSATCDVQANMGGVATSGSASF